jgi:hypothetical protein
MALQIRGGEEDSRLHANSDLHGFPRSLDFSKGTYEIDCMAAIIAFLFLYSIFWFKDSVWVWEWRLQLLFF